MLRRDFLSRALGASPRLEKALRPRPLLLGVGLEPWQPDQENPWDESALRHLLGRAAFGATAADISALLPLGPAAVVDTLFAPAPMPEPPSWANTPPPLRPTQEQLQEIQLQQRELVQWWSNLIIATRRSIRERLTLFWHGYFTSDARTVIFPQFVYKQNNAFRTNAAGNCKQLTRTMVSDPAMLIYLDGIRNVRGRPNENFAREILELFTLGEGNYTEADIVEAAKAFTGWTISGLDGVFDSRRHQPGPKQFMGSVVQSADGALESDAIVDIIFRQTLGPAQGYDASHPYFGKNAAAVHFARRLYTTFVYEIPDESVVAALADIIESSDFVIEPALRTLFLSAHFFHPELRAAKIKSPIDLLVAFSRHIEYPRVPLLQFNQASNQLGLELFAPPDVAGWPGWRTWINTSTLPLRVAVCTAFINGTQVGSSRPLQSKPDIAAFFATFTDDERSDSLLFTRAVVRRYLLFMPDADTMDYLHREALLRGQPDYEWLTISASAAAADYIKSLLVAVVSLPEYQLT